MGRDMHTESHLMMNHHLRYNRKKMRKRILSKGHPNSVYAFPYTFIAKIELFNQMKQET